VSTLSKEQVKEIIKGNNFQSVADVSAYLRDIFKDIIQELLEAELEAKLEIFLIRHRSSYRKRFMVR